MNSYLLDQARHIKPHFQGFTEYVIPQLDEWRSKGIPSALVTLTRIDGNAPRPLGSQIAVNIRGEYVGQITSGCAEAALASEAVACLMAGKNRLVRYGKGSPYLDITLPCGSGLDVYFDCQISDSLIGQLNRHHDAREAVTLLIDTEQPQHTKITSKIIEEENERIFLRPYQPTTRLVIAGTGPSVTALAKLAGTMDWESIILSSDEQTRNEASQHCMSTHGLKADLSKITDPWTACITLFHEHDLELPVLEHMLKSGSFFIGALGSRSTHQARLQALREQGLSEVQLQRIVGPVGLDIGSKSPTEIAVSIAAQIIRSLRRDETT